MGVTIVLYRGKFSQFSFLLLILGLIAVLVVNIPQPVSSQDTFIEDAVRQSSISCGAIDRNEACLGNQQASATFQEDAANASFKKPGDIAGIAGLQSITTAGLDTADQTWGVAYLRPGAGLPEADGSAMTLVLMGDSTLTSAVSGADLTVCTGKNLNSSPLNISTAPGLDKPLLGVLAPLQIVTVNGQDASQQWLRVVINGKLGWVAMSEVAIDCEASKLAVADETDLSPLYTQPMQAFTLQTSTDNTPEAPNGLFIQSPLGETARLLVNGVQIDVSGSGFLTAVQDDALSVSGLQGRVTLTASNTSVTVLPGSMSAVPLTDLLASDAPTDPQSSKDVNLPALLNGLVFGQPYNGPDSTVTGLAVPTTNVALSEDGLFRFDLSFTGDAAVCQAGAEKPFLDVVFALDTSDAMAGATLDTATAGVSNFIQHLDPGTDLVSTVAFNGQATPLSPLGADFGRAINSLSDLKTQNARAIDIGLGAAFSQLKAGRAGTAAQVIILITGGDSDATLAQKVADEIKNNGVRLITIGVGDDANPELLASLATSESDALIAQNPIQLRDLLDTAWLSLTHEVAARDLTVTYQVNEDQFEPVNDLMSLSGGKAKRNTIEWRVPVIWDTQTLTFPVAVRPTSIGDTSIGTASVSYLACADGNQRIELGEIAAPFVGVNSAGNGGPLSGVLSAGETANGAVRAFGQQAWALDVAGGQTISVTTETTQDALKAVLVGASGAAIQPLYTLENIDGSQRDQSVFFVPEGNASWLYLQSDTATVAGAYSVTVEAGAVQAAEASLVPDSASIQDEQSQGEGRIYEVPGADGDRLTFRYTANGNAPDADPITVFGLDGQAADVLATNYDVRANQWVSLVMLKGAGPYRAMVRSTGTYGLGVELGDTLTNARGNINVGETRDTDAKNDASAIFTYTLNVPQAEEISVVLGGSATQSTIRDVDNRVVALVDRLAVNEFKVDFYHLDAGSYTLYLPAAGTFRISVAEGDVSQSLKGTVRPGQTRQGSLGRNESLAVYSIVEGSGKPLVAGDLVTVTLDAEEVDKNNVYVESSDGVRSALTVEPITDVVNRTTKRLVSVHQLQGVGPYRIIVTGLQSYIVHLDLGDLLNNDKGSLVLGQTVRDSSRAPQYLIYTISPELGKGLVEGDIVTVSFLNQADTDKPFFIPFVEDGKKNSIGTQVSYRSGRQFVGVYQLAGSAPYRLIIPNIGSYVLSVNIGNRLELDQGELVVGELARGASTGPQVVHYTLNADEAQILTVKLSITSRGSFSSVTITDADGEAVKPKRELYDGGFIRVYDLSGNSPYRVTFQMDGSYELSADPGDKLTLDKGNFFIGDAETDEVKAELGLQVVTYKLDIQAGQTITVQLNSDRNYYNFRLTAPDGTQINPVQDFTFRDSQRVINRKDVFSVTGCWYV